MRVSAQKCLRNKEDGGGGGGSHARMHFIIAFSNSMGAFGKIAGYWFGQT